MGDDTCSEIKFSKEKVEVVSCTCAFFSQTPGVANLTTRRGIYYLSQQARKKGFYLDKTLMERERSREREGVNGICMYVLVCDIVVVEGKDR